MSNGGALTRGEGWKPPGMALFYPIVPSCQIKPLDLLLYEVFGERADGTFVEIGAYDGESFSNTAGLADLGWQGLYVEPVPAFAQTCRRRHRDNAVSVVQAAVSDTAEPVILHLADGDTTANPDSGTAARATGTLEVPAITPAELAASRPEGRAPDVLVLDCEGGEGAVLRAMDLQATWRATMIILESRALTPWESAKTRGESQALLDLLAAGGWATLWHDLINAVLVRREHLAALGHGWEHAAAAHARFGDPAAARDGLTRALERNPRAGRLWAWLAELADADGDAGDDGHALARARDLEAGRYYAALANRELRRNDLDGAGRAVDRCRLVAPEAPETHRLAARLALAAGDLTAARRHLARAAGLDGGSLETARIDADLAEATGDHAAAAGALRQAVAAGGSASDRLRLARVELRLGRSAAAEAVVRPAVATDPQNPHLLHLLSEALEAQDQLACAGEVAEQAARAGRDVGLWRRAAELADRGERPEVATALLWDAHARYPGDTGLALALSRRLDTQDRRGEACGVLLRAVAAGASGPEIAARLGDGRTHTGAPAAAPSPAVTSPSQRD